MKPLRGYPPVNDSQNGGDSNDFYESADETLTAEDIVAAVQQKTLAQDDNDKGQSPNVHEASPGAFAQPGPASRVPSTGLSTAPVQGQDQESLVLLEATLVDPELEANRMAELVSAALLQQQQQPDNPSNVVIATLDEHGQRNEKKSQKRGQSMGTLAARRRWWFGGFAASLLLIGFVLVVLAVSVGLRPQSDNNSNTKDEELGSDDDALETYPSLAPSSKGDEQPSASNSNTENTDCQQGIPLFGLPATISLVYENSTIFNVPENYHFPCPTIMDVHRSPWYWFTGTGECVTFTANSTDNDTLLTIYNQINGCEALECVYMLRGRSPRVSFRTRLGVVYNVVLTGPLVDTKVLENRNYFASGEVFDCLLEETCQGAIEIRDPLPVNYSIATHLATQYVQPLAERCNVIQPESLGVWFRLSASFDSGCVRMSVFPDTLMLPPTLAVYSGDCNDLQCVVGQELDSSLSDGYSLAFNTTSLVSYSIYITGPANDQNQFIIMGDLELLFEKC